ncbi:hypothetical protein E3T37_00025 [Cryobacterium sp. TMT2-10]|nr:hypothetical protein E3T37_00025 [Cryobacterium sp. TMT2-10]
MSRASPRNPAVPGRRHPSSPELATGESGPAAPAPAAPAPAAVPPPSPWYPAEPAPSARSGGFVQVAPGIPAGGNRCGRGCLVSESGSVFRCWY